VLLLTIEAEVIISLVSGATVIEYEAVLKRPGQSEATGLDGDAVDGFLGNRGKMPGAAADQAGRIFALT
jgi:hypothetical protein